MDKKDTYIKFLECTIQEKLLPVYIAYYISKGEDPPELNLPIVDNSKKIPMLLRGF
jgi:hypothetical protein